MLYLASIWVIPVVIAVTFHEAAHGFVARFLGDETAWKLGRVSLNPIKHIDPFGTILLDLSATPQTLWVLVARG
jgi:Zn-dependent protease